MIPIVPAPTPAIIAYVHHDFQKIESKGDIKMLESNKIWTNFEEISNIYRESGHDKEVSDFLRNSFQKSGFIVEQKPDGTICAFRGLNKAKNNAIILQAHMDIVGISADGNSKKPIKTHVEDGWLYANDRTLGADNGIGVAAMIAIAEDPKFKDSPLEMIVTTEEETGMTGARGLSSSDFFGKYLINLDSEEDGQITKGCAGIAQFDINEKIKMTTEKGDDFEKITIKLSGAKGGHSALITPESLNPIKVLLSELKTIKNLKLVSLSGGERYNAVPRDASAEILVSKSNAQAVIESLNKDLETLKSKNSAQNPDFNFTITSETAAKDAKYIDKSFEVKMLDLLDKVPTGLLSKFEDNGSTKTSQNLGVIKIKNGNFHVQIMGRSSDIKEGKELKNKTSEILSKLFDKKISVSDTTPIWQPKSNSKLEKIAEDGYAELHGGKKPVVVVDHGGLEAAIFIEKKPDLDEISIGPTIEDPHSIKEKVKIDTVLSFYEWLSKIIELAPKK